jgi:hypothetical protein
MTSRLFLMAIFGMAKAVSLSKTGRAWRDCPHMPQKPRHVWGTQLEAREMKADLSG